MALSMQAPRPVVGRYYRPELDVVRFLAFILVFVHHSLPDSADHRISPFLKGFAPVYHAITISFGFGLSLFFTLSAFLICELLLRERESVGAVAVKQFYIRRILRIWPLYYLALGFGLIAALLPGGHRGDAASIAWYAVFLGAWHASFHGWLRNPVSPLWSISVEEQFYLLAPWVTKYFTRKLLYGFCAAIVLFSNAWLYYLGSINAVDYRIWFDSFVQFQCFAAGILLCLVLHGRLPQTTLWQRMLLLAASGAAWFAASYAFHYRFDTVQGPGSLCLMSGYALGAAGSVGILLAFLGLSPKLIPGWAIYLGRISYGLYVYHEFVPYLLSKLLIGHLASFNTPIYFLKGGLSLGLTILVAAISYRYFEAPFLRLKKRHAVIESQPILDAG
jgi:peptidoglycan/LPS O-acetylase OafA/YrhL